MPIILLLPVAIMICGFGAFRATGRRRWIWLSIGGLLMALWLSYVMALALMTLPD